MFYCQGLRIERLGFRGWGERLGACGMRFGALRVWGTGRELFFQSGFWGLGSGSGDLRRINLASSSVVTKSGM